MGLSNQPHFQIMTSIRSDGLLLESAQNAQLHISSQAEACQFYMLDYHLDRMLVTAQEFGWNETVGYLKTYGSALLDVELKRHLSDEYGNPKHPEPLKLRILLSQSNNFKITSAPTPALSLSTLFPATLPPSPQQPPTWQIFISPHQTHPSNYTSHKTTLRTAYDDARALLPPSSTLPAEILLVNPHGEIMEGSITTPYFLRDGQWITPAASQGGNVGTTRRWALKMGLCVEGCVERKSVGCGEMVWLSNGVRGWGWGRVEELRDG